jgi:hypothetical protein
MQPAEEQTMSEYVIRLSRENAPQMLFISLLKSDQHAARKARNIMAICGLAHAEVWKGHRLVLALEPA